MSRPNASVPRMYSGVPPSTQTGGISLSRKVWSIGEYGASSGAKTAIATITAMMQIGIHGTRRPAPRLPLSVVAGPANRQVPAIHADGRNKSGHDDFGLVVSVIWRQAKRIRGST